MTESIILAVIAALTSSAAFTFIQFLITRKDKKRSDNDDSEQRAKRIESSIREIERDNVRIQLLIMMTHYPNEVNKIMKLAERYFKTLDGDWYMTGLFNSWVEEHNVGKPEWFITED